MRARKARGDDTSYQDAPEDVIEAFKSAKRIEDTVPPPTELVRKKRSVTIRLDADVVEWFEQQSGQYQKLINEASRRFGHGFQSRLRLRRGRHDKPTDQKV